MKAWLEKHQRFTRHFTPTSSSWLNLMERWFRELTEKSVRRGNFESVPDLELFADAIEASFAEIAEAAGVDSDQADLAATTPA